MSRYVAHSSPPSVRVTVAVFASVLIVATLVPLIPTNRWWLRIFVFPQAQIATLLVVAGIAVSLAFSLRRPAGLALLVGLALSLAYQLQYLLQYTQLWPKEVPNADGCSRSDRIRTLVLNVKQGDVANAETIALVRSVEPELFLAIETEPEWLHRMGPLQKEFEHVVAAPRSDAWGMTLFSKLPLASPEVRYLVDDYVPSIKTGVRLPGGAELNFYGLHPKPPFGQVTQRGDIEMIRVGREIASGSKPALLAGDLNDVPWSRTVSRFQEISGMHDPRVGRTFAATFRLAPLVGWPLDHVYASQDFRLVSFDTGPDIGSDHLPLLADFCLA